MFLKSLSKTALALSLALFSVLPAIASNTGLTINAEVDSVISLQLETSSGTVVSPDDVNPSLGAPASDEILDFGLVDPFAINAGTLTATNGPASGALNKQLLVSGEFKDEQTFSGAMSASDGAVYFIENGYQLRGLRNDGGTDMDVDVEVTGATALDTIIDDTTANSFSANSTMASSSKRVVGAGLSSLNPNMALNTPFPIDIGIIVPVSQPAGQTSTEITFYGT